MQAHRQQPLARAAEAQECRRAGQSTGSSPPNWPSI